ncbi:hypothetical protein FRC02_007748 [Tulasnella sp. 418]|nr:hypothetical protein FRC02_007748 [Tulasnella sp. 418]
MQFLLHQVSKLATTPSVTMNIFKPDEHLIWTRYATNFSSIPALHFLSHLRWGISTALGFRTSVPETKDFNGQFLVFWARSVIAGKYVRVKLCGNGSKNRGKVTNRASGA